MCIICVKQAGVKLPKDKTIRAMFENNSNGAGFAYKTEKDDTVKIEKGFFEVKAFIDAVRSKVRREYSAVLHFRLATSGATDAGNCHPFPVLRDVETMRQTSAIVEIAAAHNGVFSMPTDKLYSDTQLWIASRLADDSIVKNLHRSAVQHLLQDSLGTSKLAIIAKSMKNVLMFGAFEHDKKSGLYYSNTGYKKDREYWRFMPSKWAGHFAESGNDFNRITSPSTYGEHCELCGMWTPDEDLLERENMLLCQSCWSTMKTADNGGRPVVC